MDLFEIARAISGLKKVAIVTSNKCSPTVASIHEQVNEILLDLAVQDLYEQIDLKETDDWTTEEMKNIVLDNMLEFGKDDADCVCYNLSNAVGRGNMLLAGKIVAGGKIEKISDYCLPAKLTDNWLEFFDKYPKLVPARLASEVENAKLIKEVEDLRVRLKMQEEKIREQQETILVQSNKLLVKNTIIAGFTSDNDMLE